MRYGPEEQHRGNKRTESMYARVNACAATAASVM